METVSENSKGERGRPRKYARVPGDYLEEFERYTKEPSRAITEKESFTTRQQQNIIHAERASDYLEDYYLHGGKDQERYELAANLNEVCVPPQRVKTELGRFLPDREEDFWRCALWYVNYPFRLRAQDGARVIREFRLGKRIALPGE